MYIWIVLDHGGKGQENWKLFYPYNILHNLILFQDRSMFRLWTLLQMLLTKADAVAVKH